MCTRGRLAVLVFCTLNSLCGLFFAPLWCSFCIEKLKCIFQLCLLNHCYILTLVHKVVVARPTIISITRWFLRRVPWAAELITPSVLNNCCYPPALTFCFALVISRSQTEKYTQHTLVILTFEETDWRSFPAGKLTSTKNRVLTGYRNLRRIRF